MSPVLFLAIIVIGLQLVFGTIVVRIAKKKGLKIVPWTVWGYSFGPLALPFVLMAKSENES